MLLRSPPIVVTAVTMTTATNDAINAYSIAVTPASSFHSLRRFRIMDLPYAGSPGAGRIGFYLTGSFGSLSRGDVAQPLSVCHEIIPFGSAAVSGNALARHANRHTR